MSGIVIIALVAAFLVWLLGLGKGRAASAPEDDVATPVDEDELATAEREVRDDDSARPIGEALKDAGGEDDDDDWGPGTGRSSLPGIL